MLIDMFLIVIMVIAMIFFVKYRRITHPQYSVIDWIWHFTKMLAILLLTIVVIKTLVGIATVGTILLYTAAAKTRIMATITTYSRVFKSINTLMSSTLFIRNDIFFKL